MQNKTGGMCFPSVLFCGDSVCFLRSGRVLPEKLHHFVPWKKRRFHILFNDSHKKLKDPNSPITGVRMIKVRPFTFEEQLTLPHWHGADNLQAYMIARILILAQKDWPFSDIAFAFLISEELINDIIQVFNQSGLQALCLTQFRLRKELLFPIFKTNLNRN